MLKITALQKISSNSPVHLVKQVAIKFFFIEGNDEHLP